MADNPTDESLPEELDAEATQEGANADQTQRGAEEDSGDECQDAHDDDGKLQGDPSEELAKVKDQLLRTLAEMENVRRRAQRDVENAHKFAVEKLLSELLPVVDSLEKAEELAKTSDNADSMAEGISLSLKLFVTDDCNKLNDASLTYDISKLKSSILLLIKAKLASTDVLNSLKSALKSAIADILD